MKFNFSDGANFNKLTINVEGEYPDPIFDTITDLFNSKNRNLSFSLLLNDKAEFEFY